MREWDTGMMCKDRRFLSLFMESLCRVRNRIMYVPSWRTVFALTLVLFWCLFPKLRSNEGNKHQNNTLVSAETVRHSSTYIILYICHHIPFACFYLWYMQRFVKTKYKFISKYDVIIYMQGIFSEDIWNLACHIYYYSSGKDKQRSLDYGIYVNVVSWIHLLYHLHPYWPPGTTLRRWYVILHCW